MRPVLCHQDSGVPDILSLAALSDLGLMVDMTKATPWRSGAVVATSAKLFRERVDVRIVPRPQW